jgi:hypothetical protein
MRPSDNSDFEELLQIDRALVEFAHIRFERAEACEGRIHAALEYLAPDTF